MEDWRDRQDFYSLLEASGQLSLEHTKPDISAESFYLECFSELSSERQIGMDIGPIPISKIIWYQEHFKLSNIFQHVIMGIDHEYLNLRADKNKKPSGK